MTERAPTCPDCGKPSFRHGWHCVACLEETMKNMTAEDLKRELDALCDEIVRTDKAGTR